MALWLEAIASRLEAIAIRTLKLSLVSICFDCEWAPPFTMRQIPNQPPSHLRALARVPLGALGRKTHRVQGRGAAAQDLGQWPLKGNSCRVPLEKADVGQVNPSGSKARDHLKKSLFLKQMWPHGDPKTEQYIGVEA